MMIEYVNQMPYPVYHYITRSRCIWVSTEKDQLDIGRRDIELSEMTSGAGNGSAIVSIRLELPLQQLAFNNALPLPASEHVIAAMGPYEVHHDEHKAPQSLIHMQETQPAISTN